MTEVAAHRPPAAGSPRLFGTFGGVFTPTLLTILGVIMYLRLGWVVGNAGLLGGLLIILLANGITLATGLSLSSIATNTRLGAGGPYAIISKALGLEIGGSVGVPLFLSQALAAAMYIFGFREGWLWIFPAHSPLLVDLVVFAVILTVASLSASLAFRIQYLVMAVIGLSLVAIFATPGVWTEPAKVSLWGSYPGALRTAFAGTDFWHVFAVFFPAVTGVMAGANMSGDLRDPRRSIPLGTLSAIGLSAVIYVALAFWCVRAGTSEELLRDYTIMMDRSPWGAVVLAGLLGATFSSALTSMVGAPRILRAMGVDRLIPASRWVAHTAADGEPRRATALTGALVLAALMTRHLNVIAELITMFFLITYAVINVVMLAEASLGLMSFRPTLRLPRVVPLFGAVGSVFVMFIVNPTFGLVAGTFVIALYLWILWRGDLPMTGTVRSGIFEAFAEWSAAKVLSMELTTSRAWKPNLLVPVENPAAVRGEFKFLTELCRPEGSIKLLGLATSDSVGVLTPRLQNLSDAFRRHGTMTTYCAVDSAGYTTGIVTGLQVLRSAFFSPNILFLRLPDATERYAELRGVLREAERLRVGQLLLALHPQSGLGRTSVLKLWAPPRAEGQDLATYLRAENLNLAVLAALRIAQAWRTPLRLVTAVPDSADSASAQRNLDELIDLCRIPKSAVSEVIVGDIETCLATASQSDLDIMALRPAGDGLGPDLEQVTRMVTLTRSSCLFAGDSGAESALA